MSRTGSEYSMRMLAIIAVLVIVAVGVIGGTSGVFTDFNDYLGGGLDNASLGPDSYGDDDGDGTGSDCASDSASQCEAEGGFCIGGGIAIPEGAEGEVVSLSCEEATQDCYMPDSSGSCEANGGTCIPTGLEGMAVDAPGEIDSSYECDSADRPLCYMPPDDSGSCPEETTDSSSDGTTEEASNGNDGEGLASPAYSQLCQQYINDCDL